MSLDCTIIVPSTIHQTGVVDILARGMSDMPKFRFICFGKEEEDALTNREQNLLSKSLHLYYQFVFSSAIANPSLHQPFILVKQSNENNLNSDYDAQIIGYAQINCTKIAKRLQPSMSHMHDTINLRSDKKQQSVFVKLCKLWFYNYNCIAIFRLYIFGVFSIYQSQFIKNIFRQLTNDDRGFYGLGSVVIDPKYQSKGFGTKFVQLILQKIIEMYRNDDHNHKQQVQEAKSDNCIKINNGIESNSKLLVKTSNDITFNNNSRYLENMPPVFLTCSEKGLIFWQKCGFELILISEREWFGMKYHKHYHLIYHPNLHILKTKYVNPIKEKISQNKPMFDCYHKLIMQYPWKIDLDPKDGYWIIRWDQWRIVLNSIINYINRSLNDSKNLLLYMFIAGSLFFTLVVVWFVL